MGLGGKRKTWVGKRGQVSKRRLDLDEEDKDRKRMIWAGKGGHDIEKEHLCRKRKT